MYCVGSINFTKNQLRRFHGVHFKMLRRILAWRRRSDYTAIGDVLADVANRVQSLFDKSGLEWWDTYALRQVHAWAGYVCRMRVYDPTRWVLRALRFRDHRFLARLVEDFGTQCHGHRFHVWRWERTFYDHYGDDWPLLPLNGDEWNEAFLHGYTGGLGNRHVEIQLKTALEFGSAESGKSSTTSSASDSCTGE